MPFLSLASGLRRTTAGAVPFGRRLAITAALSLSLVGIAACGDDDTGPGARGTYELQTVDGIPLPATIQLQDPNTGQLFDVTFTDGSLELSSGDEFDVSVSYTGDLGTETLTDDGTYDIDEDRIVFESDGGELEGEIDDDQITVDLPIEELGGVEFTMVFERDDDDDDDDN